MRRKKIISVILAAMLLSVIVVAQSSKKAAKASIWTLRGETARQNVRLALETGFRHIDTAQMYSTTPKRSHGDKKTILFIFISVE